MTLHYFAYEYIYFVLMKNMVICLGL